MTERKEIACERRESSACLWTDRAGVKSELPDSMAAVVAAFLQSISGLYLFLQSNWKGCYQGRVSRGANLEA